MTASLSLFQMVGGSRRKEERDVEALLRKLDLAKSARKNWDNHCSEVALRMWPEADDFITKRSPNEKRRHEVFDSTAARALGKFAAAMQSLLIPRQQLWHKLKASDEALNKDASVKAWFEELNLVLFRIRNSPRANYYGQMRVGMKSLGAFGGLCLFVDENEAGGIRYRHCHLGQIYIATNHEGRVDTIFRVYPLSAKAALQQWGQDKIGEKVKAALEKNPWQEFDFAHCVMPRLNRDPQAMGPEAMRWDSVYIGVEDRNALEEGGYQELPYMYGRWDISPSEVYPRSPAMECLAEQKVLNSQERALLRLAHVAADPPVMMSDEGVFGSGSRNPRFVPGAPLYGMLDSQGKPRALPFISGGRVELTTEMMEQKRTAINDSFLVTLFRILVEDPRSNVTAYEIAQRMQEKGELLAPSVSSQQSELLGPEIERSVNIILRQGLIGPPPPVLLEAAGEYEIEYVSPAAQLQRAAELAGITRTIQLVEPLAENDPTVYDVFDPEEIARIGADINGAPSKALRTPEELEELRAQRAQAQQAAQQAEMAQMGAGAMKDGAQALRVLQGGAGGGAG
jgi:hypothetical protein